MLVSEDRYDGQPIDCPKCGRRKAAKWNWFKGDVPEDSHWWKSSCWRCTAISSMKLEMTMARVIRNHGPEEALRRIVRGMEEDDEE